MPPCFEGVGRLPCVDLFQIYFPQMYDCYQKCVDELIQRDPTLRRNFAGTPFGAGSINFGPKTECYPHRDWGNVSWGECVLAAFGDYNAEEGGHLAFWDLGLVVRFPPGSVIFLPSALVRHSNTPVAPHECRYSFTQYMPGGYSGGWGMALSLCQRRSQRRFNESGGAMGWVCSPCFRSSSCTQCRAAARHDGAGQPGCFLSSSVGIPLTSVLRHRSIFAYQYIVSL